MGGTFSWLDDRNASIGLTRGPGDLPVPPDRDGPSVWRLQPDGGGAGGRWRAAWLSTLRSFPVSPRERPKPGSIRQPRSEDRLPHLLLNPPGMPCDVTMRCQSREASGEDPMTLERSQWPLLVRFGLLGITTRTMAWLFALGSLMISIVFLAMKAFVAGGAFFLAACWYLWVIRWVNRHGHWS